MLKYNFLLFLNSTPLISGNHNSIFWKYQSNHHFDRIIVYIEKVKLSLLQIIFFHFNGFLDDVIVLKSLKFRSMVNFTHK